MKKNPKFWLFILGLFLFVSFVLVTVLACGKMVYLSYLNDEWIQYGLVQIHGWTAELLKFSWLGIFLGSARPLGTIVNNLFFIYLPFQAWPFFVWAVIFHSINGLLCYLIAYKLSKNIRISVLCSLFFITSSVSYQTFAWLAATVQGVASTTFILLGLYIYLLFLKTYKKRFLIGTFISLYVAVLLKDSSFFALLALPLLFMLFNKKSISKRTMLAIIVPSVLLIGALGVYRVALSMSGFQNRLVQLGTNALLYPFISIPHFFVPYRYMYKMAEVFEKMAYPTIMTIVTKENVTLLAYTMVSDFLSIIGAIFGISIVCLTYIKRVADRKIIQFAVLFYMLCFLPVAFYLDHRNASYVESRYLYIMNFPVGLLFAFVVDQTICYVGRLKNRVGIAMILCIYVGVGMIFIKNIQVTQREIFDSVTQGNMLMSAVKAMKAQWTILPDKAIVYIEGDRFFYHPTLKVPFQLGPGFMTMVLYYPTGKIPKEFISKWYLLSVTDQGYKEIGDQGFGYFYELNALKDLFRNNAHVTTDQIVGMQYDSHSGTFIDISDRVRAAVKQL